MKSVTTKFLAVAVLAVGFAAPSFADFSGPYDLANWTPTNGPGGTGGTAIDTSGGPAVLGFDGGNSDQGCELQDCVVNFSVPVAGNGNITFDWGYQTFDQDGPAFDSFGYFVDNVPTQLSDDMGGDVQNGNGIVAVLSGQTFGFYFDCEDCTLGKAIAPVRLFNGPVDTGPPGQVPEPVSLALLGIGLLGLGASRLRARRS